MKRQPVRLGKTVITVAHGFRGTIGWTEHGPRTQIAWLQRNPTYGWRETSPLPYQKAFQSRYGWPGSRARASAAENEVVMRIG